jgi:RNA polymerase sigma factor (sigma-70 family)
MAVRFSGAPLQPPETERPLSSASATASTPLARLADAAVVARCRHGDQDAWNELVERYSRYVYSICVQGYSLRDADAEDVFQDVWTRVWDRLHTLRSDDAVKPWIAQMTRRCCIDRHRSGARVDLVDDPDELVVDRAVADLDEALAVRAAMATLSGDCRDVLDRFFCQDESYRDIGEHLGLPGGTIASRISRCLSKLREALA